MRPALGLVSIFQSRPPSRPSPVVGSPLSSSGSASSSLSSPSSSPPAKPTKPPFKRLVLPAAPFTAASRGALPSREGHCASTRRSWWKSTEAHEEKNTIAFFPSFPPVSPSPRKAPVARDATAATKAGNRSFNGTSTYHCVNDFGTTKPVSPGVSSGGASPEAGPAASGSAQKAPSRRQKPAKRRTAGDNVADTRKVWGRAGVTVPALALSAPPPREDNWSQICRTCRSKPMSSNRSASSSTKQHKPDVLNVAVCSKWYAKRPGVAHRTVAPFRSRAFSLFGFSPPATALQTMFGAMRVRSCATFAVCNANSLVGDKTIAKVPSSRVPPCSKSLCRTGIRNANVFPEPVGARNRKSRATACSLHIRLLFAARARGGASSAAGMASPWIGVHRPKPKYSNCRCKEAWTGRSRIMRPTATSLALSAGAPAPAGAAA
mmetsp:Transcript_32909/g.99436  ORF Transcript_32909/g.99436 Transcript_32909/m.99436 type:complete len:434 (-) Transcript_32909:90-1391(-)